MKILRDASAFEGRTPTLYFSSGKRRYYSSCPGRSLEFAAMPERPERCPLWTSAIYREDLKPGTHHRREYAHFMAVELVTSGSLYLHQEGRAYLIESGDAFITRPCPVHEFATGPGGRCRKSSMMIEGPLLESALKTMKLADVDILPNFDARSFEMRIDALRELSNGLGEAEAGKIGCLTYETLQSLGARTPSKELPADLQSLLAFMEARLDEKLTLDDLARRAGRSVPSLIRLFNASLGRSPIKTLIMLRMSEAARLLMKQDSPVKEIAAKVGYDDALNFSTEFRKRFGASPRAYRESGGAIRQRKSSS